MTAHHDDAAGTGAVVRKPPGKEPAGDGGSDAARYGDLAAANRPDEVRAGAREAMFAIGIEIGA
jgi:hypothetical protein